MVLYKKSKNCKKFERNLAKNLSEIKFWSFIEGFNLMTVNKSYSYLCT